MDGISRSCGWVKQAMWMGYAGHVGGICRSCGWDNQVTIDMDGVSWSCALDTLIMWME